jgi:hypothetical protein
MPTSTDPNAPVIAFPPLTRGQFWGLLGAILVAVVSGYVGLIYVLVHVVYGGIDDRIKSLEDSFKTAISASADVKHLLDTSPTLERQISETSIDVKGLKDSMSLLNPLETHDIIVSLKPVPQQLQEIKTQLDSMQYQIHHPDKHK